MIELALVSWVPFLKLPFSPAGGQIGFVIFLCCPVFFNYFSFSHYRRVVRGTGWLLVLLLPSDV